MTAVPSHTFAMLKPDVTRARVVGAVLTMMENAGFRIRDLEMKTLATSEVRDLYAEHVGKPFFAAMTAFLTSGPVVGVILGRTEDDAVERWRALMGPTDASKAPPGTVRHMFGARSWREVGILEKTISVPTDANAPLFVNAVHGSDSTAAYHREVPIFFGNNLLHGID